MEELIASELARRLGLHPSRITQYNKAGVLNEAKRGKRRGRQLYDYDVSRQLIEARQDPNFTKKTPQARYRDKKKGGNGQAVAAAAGLEESPDSFLQWRTFTEQYKAADKKLDYEIKAGKYLLKSEIKRTLTIIAHQLRESLLNAPSRTSAIVAAKSKKAQEEIYQILLKQAEITLKDISDKLKKVAL